MSFFNVEITGGDTPISMSSQISDVKLWMDTENDNVSSKPGGLLMKVIIEGKIKAENPDPYQAMFKWAKDFNGKTQYRAVKIKIYDGSDETGDLYREYSFGKMFVVDYVEVYKDKDDKNDKPVETGIFTLSLTQKDDNWDSVECLK